ncbi:MAG TPA: hypothetical protein P5121_39395 [Caldilineaceae bacterium]|nr:hypothetical protein [Caldilineaceae bacterium]
MTFLPEVRELTTAQEQLLHDTQIDEDEPGSILRDFATMLAFIDEGSVTLTETHLLPLKVLAPLNERLTTPLTIGLQRPSLKSYPPIEGLYLLARASELTVIDETGKKPHLWLNPEAYASWQTLNPTERYFTLLENWVLRGEPEILGENGNLFDFAGPLSGWHGFFSKVPEQGITIRHGTEDERSLRYFPGLRNLALLQMFGFAVIHDDPPVEGEGWQIGTIERTDLGDAVLPLLVQHFSTLLETTEVLPPPDLVPIGQLQPTFQPYFPAWQRNLVIPGHGFTDGVYLFRVALDDEIWRRIAIPATLTLDDLTHVIMDAFAFDHEHLSEYIYRSRAGVEQRIRSMTDGEEIETDMVRVGDLPLQPGASMVLHYDLLYDWLFALSLEQIEPAEGTIRKPAVIEQHGTAPDQYA